MRLYGRRIAVLGISACLTIPIFGAEIYNNLTPNNQMAMATRPDTTSFEIESADDFLLNSPASITNASFVGLVNSATGSNFTVSQVVVEIYRIFPLDSDTTRTPNVPTRANSPSDVALVSRDSGAGELTFGTSTLSSSFTALNSVQPGGIHAFPNQNTNGNGPISGQEIQINVDLTTPIDLAAGHYFFIPQVQVTNGAQFYWLSASRPISGAGTTPFTGDLQAWTRDAALDPDWLRVGTDIVGGSPAPTFNAAFSLSGTATPEPSSVVLCLAGIAALAIRRARAAR